jgi:glucosamine-6-phosphate deaminase
MDIRINQSAIELGKAAGASAAELIREAIKTTGTANIILATGTSQFETLKQLILEPGIDWGKVVIFHLDEYIGLPITHPASFRKYLIERFITKVPALKAAHLINGEADPKAECDRLNYLINQCSITVALVGIGENGHLAFNDPPADFNIEDPYIIVELDNDCRKQQLGEGWFKSIEEVPKRAISMSVKQILKSENIICSVPETRKAQAVKNTLEHPISNFYPASILQLHANCILYLDETSAALLDRKTLRA